MQVVTEKPLGRLPRRRALGFGMGGLTVTGLLARRVPGAVAQPVVSAAHAIEGAWRIVGTRPVPGAPPVLYLVSVLPGGHFVVSNARVESAGHGVWQPLDERRIAVTFEHLLFFTEPEPQTLITRIAATLTLDETGDLQGPFRATARYLGGEELLVEEGTLVGSRIILERLG